MVLLHRPPTGLIPHDAPDTFSVLMDLYERNYINIRRLLPVMPPAQTEWVSRTPGGLDLHLRVAEHCRYTSEMLLTYQFNQEDHVIVTEPNLRIRVYHDARLAEAMTAQPRHHPVFTTHFLSDTPSEKNILLFSRWRINRFLYKWLSYCLRQGHCFSE